MATTTTTELATNSDADDAQATDAQVHELEIELILVKQERDRLLRHLNTVQDDYDTICAMLKDRMHVRDWNAVRGHEASVICHRVSMRFGLLNAIAELANGQAQKYVPLRELLRVWKSSHFPTPRED